MCWNWQEDWPGKATALELVEPLRRVPITEEVVIRHLANPNKLAHLTVINRRLGLLTPQVVTPEMLWLEDEE